MSYTETTNLHLRKDNGDEKIIDMRPHLNTNLDTIDQAYAELDDRCRGQQTWGNLKSTTTWGELKGNGVTTPSSQTTNLQLIKPGYDSNVDVEVFNDNMDVIDSAIGPLPSDKTLQGQISTLQDSVGLKYVETYVSNINRPGSVGAGTYVEVSIPTKSGYVPISIDIMGWHPGACSYALQWGNPTKFTVVLVQYSSSLPATTTFSYKITYAPIGSPLAAVAF